MQERIIKKQKYCENCHKQVAAQLVRTVSANGKNFVYWLCPLKDHQVSRGAFYISKKLLAAAEIDVESLPIHRSYLGTETCAVCGNPAVELHHWAPSYLFDDSWDWPTSYLCREHHMLWHSKVTPEMHLHRRDK